jgi:hypothetical protein
MPFDLKAWLSDLATKGQLSAEDVTLLEGKLNKPEALKALEDGQLRQSDYDRMMNKLKTDHKTAMDGVVGLQTELTGWRTEAQAKLDKAMGDLQARDTTIAQYQARVTQIATDYGLDLNTLMPAAAATPNPPASLAQPASPNPAATEGFRKFQEDFDKAKQIFPLLPAELHDLSVEHQELYGKPLSKSLELVSTALKEGRSVRDVWAEQYKVEDRRKEIALETEKKHDAEIRADERNKVLSEASVPTFRPDAPRSPIFSAIPQKTAPDGKAGELSAIDRATMHFDEAMRTRTAS